MKAHAPLFPSLSAGAALADVQVRQTLALGLVPLGLVLLLVAAGTPERPPPGLWIGGGLVLGGLAVLWTLWRKSGHRPMRGFSTLHFLIRYLFIVLCPGVLWTVFGGLLLELGGVWPPVLFGLLLLVYPIGRILHERAGPHPELEPRIEMAYIACQQVQMVLGVIALMGLLSGAVLDANKDYPTDPTPLLLLLWLLALMTVLASAVMGAAHWSRLFTKPRPPQPLDDEPPPAAPRNGVQFGSDQF